MYADGIVGAHALKAVGADALQAVGADALKTLTEKRKWKKRKKSFVEYLVCMLMALQVPMRLRH